MTIRILLVEDHKILGAALGALVSSDPDLVLCGQATEGQQAVDLATELRPDVVIMDLGLPGMNGIEATRQIITARPDTAVLVLSAYGDPKRIVDALEAGASGYVLKDSAAEDLGPAIHDTAEGKAYLSARIANVVLHHWFDQTPDGLVDRLSPNAQRLFKVFSSGRSQDEIARQLSIDPSVVSALRHSLALSMVVANRRRLAGLATC